MNPALFRPQAVAKVTDPDQLDQALAIVQPRHLFAMGAVITGVAAGLVWSIIATAPVIAAGQGVLQSTAGVATITAEGSGRIEQLLVQPDERVEQGQAIAIIRQPERLDTLRAADEEAKDVEERYRVLSAEYAEQDRMQQDLVKRTRAAYEERIRSLEKQRTTLSKRQAAESKLEEKGLVSTLALFETEQLLAQMEQELATARNRLTELTLQQEQDAAQRRQALAQLQIQLQNLQRRADNLRRDYERDREVLANTAGTVAELGVDLNDPVASGQFIARVLLQDARQAALTVVAYVPAKDGKRIEAEMPVRVAPSTIKPERDGYIRGTVTRVAELPASREGMLRRLKNAVLVDEILRTGTAFEVEVQLQADPATPSGYAWTSGEGPDIRIEAGTLARVEVVVDRVHLITLVFPAMDYVYGWFRAL